MTATESDTKIRILESAELLFAERGYDGATVREIAKRANVNLAMIHYYFGNKEGLYRALIETEIAHVRGLMESAAAAKGSTAERLASFVHQYARFLFLRPAVARIMQQEVLTGGRVVDETFRPQIMRNYRALRALVDGGIESGEFRDLDAEIAPIALLGMVAFFVIARPLLEPIVGEGLDEEQAAARIADNAVRIFLDGARHPAAPVALEPPDTENDR